MSGLTFPRTRADVQNGDLVALTSVIALLPDYCVVQKQGVSLSAVHSAGLFVTLDVGGRVRPRTKHRRQSHGRLSSSSHWDELDSRVM